MSTRATVYYDEDEMEGLHLFQELADADTSVVWLEYERNGFAVLVPLPKKISMLLLEARRGGRL